MLLPSSSREGKRCRATEGVAVLVRHDMMAVIIMMSKSNSCLQNGRNTPDLSPCCRERPSQPRSGRRLSARVSLGAWERPTLNPAIERAAYRIGRLRHLELQRCGGVLARSGQPANAAGDTGLVTQPSDKSTSTGSPCSPRPNLRELRQLGLRKASVQHHNDAHGSVATFGTKQSSAQSAGTRRSSRGLS